MPPPSTPEGPAKLSAEACSFVRSRKKEIVQRFAGETFPPVQNPISIFMAGSPGAGKTEFSKSLLSALPAGGYTEPVVRIDGDEIREMLPGYTGSNSSIFQGAISIAVDRLHDHCLQKRKSFILDGTFSKLDKAQNNIQRSINAQRGVIVIYVFQDPLISWEFTRKRESSEGRNIPRDRFIEQFCEARSVCQAMKDDFGDRISLWLINRNLQSKRLDFTFRVDRIDDHIPSPYTKQQLETLLPL